MANGLGEDLSLMGEGGLLAILANIILPDWISGPVLNVGIPYAEMRQQQEAEEEAKAAAEARREEAQGVLGTPGSQEDADREYHSALQAAAQARAYAANLPEGGMRDRFMAMADKATEQAEGKRPSGLAQMGREEFARLQEEIPGGLADLETKLLGMTAGFGDQERADINRRYDELAGRQEMDLIARGAGGAGMLASMRRGVEEERTAALARLDERLRQGQLGIAMPLGMEQLGAEERLGLGGLQYQTGLGGDLVNLLASMQDIAPSQAAFGQFAQQFGQSRVDAPEGPEWWEPVVTSLPSVLGGIGEAAILSQKDDNNQQRQTSTPGFDLSSLMSDGGGTVSPLDRGGTVSPLGGGGYGGGGGNAAYGYSPISDQRTVQLF